MGLISDKKLLGFSWPPKMPSYSPKKRKQYEHSVVIAANEHDAAYVLKFTSKDSAKAYEKAAKKTTSNVTIWYEKKELPTINEEGMIVV